jgi:hypothetical protein
MKVKVRESENGLSIEMTPESVPELSQLARFVRNAKKQPPSVHLYFNSDEPIATVFMRKISVAKQINSI